jgi:alanyl-tRNA synthetase
MSSAAKIPPPTTADELREAFLAFFEARGHTRVPSASLIPHDPSVLFTVAGMVPFKPYFVGDEQPPYRRATSSQKCVRAGGKHNDLDDIGRTNRHFSFFEMLGNFSFGDYFKADAIAWAWELVTVDLGLDPDRLWVTVHESDDEAERIWRDTVGVAPDRIQRLGDDNFWRMGDVGPCGPSSEIFWDLGPEHGAEGGPAVDDDRYIEIWNLVFMQFDQQADGSLAPLPKPSIDTGAGLERILFVLQGKSSIFDSDAFAPLIQAAEKATKAIYGDDDENDVSLRIIAEHARTMTFLVADGVVPSNEERGYVLRRIIRRAVRHAFRLGAHDPVTPTMVDAVVATMSGAYPELLAQHELVRNVVSREEVRFRQTLQRGLDRLDGTFAAGDVSGADAFFLHDSLGFPIDLTREIAAERGRTVDADGFRALLKEQSDRARQAHKDDGGRGGAPVELYRELLDELGPTDFTGRQEYVTEGAKVRGLIVGRERATRAAAGTKVDLFLDRTPFYAESGGQVGDTGTIVTADGATVRIVDTQYALPGSLVLHRGEVVEGEIAEDDEVAAAIDGPRRDAIRRNHTATHILHYALREVLGPNVKQAGSSVDAERLRFDFSHHEAVTAEQLQRVEDIANSEVLTDAPVRHYETSKDHALSLGAIAFFGDKYGDIVRVLEAGEHSIELCGGTHVHALGFIGPIKIVSEGSVGANLRRIEAVTGEGALARIRDEEHQLHHAAELLKSQPAEVPERVERLLAQVKSLTDELRAVQAKQIGADAAALAASAVGGVVVTRRDGSTPDDLRQLALAVRNLIGSGIVAIVGLGPDSAKAGLAVTVSKDLQAGGISAGELAAGAAKALGGGTAKNADLVVGGGPKVAGIEEAMRLLEDAVRSAAPGARD